MSEKYNSEFNNGRNKKLGNLDVDVTFISRGRKALQWSFNYDDIEGKRKQIAIPVSYVQDRGKVHFEARSKHLPEGYMKDSDIERLRSRVEQHLEENLASISGLQWEPWLEVIVKGGDSELDWSRYSALGASLSVQVNTLSRAFCPAKDKYVTINSNGYLSDFPQSRKMSDGPLKSSPGGWTIEPAQEYSYIPDTEKNRSALIDVMERMRLLRSALADALGQDELEKSIDIISAGRFPQIKAME